MLKKVLGDEKPVTSRFADTLKSEFDRVKEQLKDITKSEEEILSYISFPQITEKFFKEREERAAMKVSYSIVKK